MNESLNEAKIRKYEIYINEVLRSDLRKVCVELDQVNEDLVEYQHLIKELHLMQEFRKSDLLCKKLVDIGCQFLMQVNIENVSDILLNLGQGCYLECSLEEALQFIEQKIKLLNNKVSSLREKSASIKGHIKLMLLYMNQLYEFRE